MSVYLKLLRGREIFVGFFFLNHSGYSFNVLEITFFIYIYYSVFWGRKRQVEQQLPLCCVRWLQPKAHSWLLRWPDFYSCFNFFLFKIQNKIFLKIFLFWLLLLFKYHLSSPSKHGESIGRGSSGPAVQHQQHTEPWDRANPEKLINVDNPVDSGGTFHISQGIVNVYGKKYNYSIFRCAIHARAVIFFPNHCRFSIIPPFTSPDELQCFCDSGYNVC